LFAFDHDVDQERDEGTIALGIVELCAERRPEALAHEVIELVRPALTPGAFEQLPAPMDQDRHMGGEQQGEFPFERPTAIGLEIEPLNEQSYDLLECINKLLSHDALPSSRGKVCPRGVKVRLRRLVSELFWKPGQSEKPRDTTASGGLLRPFNPHANCIARVASDSQAVLFHKLNQPVGRPARMSKAGAAEGRTWRRNRLTKAD